MLKALQVLCLMLALTGCAASVRVLAPPKEPVQQNPVSFTVELHPRANVSTFQATVEAPAASGIAPVDITGSFSPAPAAGQQSSASVTLPQQACPVGVPSCSHDRTFRVQALMSPRQGFDVTGHGWQFRLAGSTTPLPPPGPSITLRAPMAAATVHWGNSAAYTLELESRNGFAGQVTLTPENLTFGASAGAQTVNLAANASASATLSIGTTSGGTGLGSQTFRVRATGTGLSPRTQNLTLRVLPTQGNFAGLTWRTASSSCGNVQANVLGTVSFQGPGFNTTGIPLIWYAFTPDCRGGVVIGPSAGANAGFPAVIFNFGFPTQIANGPGSFRTLSLQAWDQTHFRAAADGSFLIATSANAGGRQASLWNMLNLSQVGGPFPYNIAATLNAAVSGQQVTVTPTIGNGFSWNLP